MFDPGNSYLQSLQRVQTNYPTSTGSSGALAQFPSWLTPGSNQVENELMQTYQGIPKAFDVSNQVGALNNSIGLQTSQGQANASAAARQYAAQAQQRGQSTLGAGSVAAQAMLPVFQQNAQLRLQGGQIQNQASQNAAQLAAEVAKNIGMLRQNYLQSLIGFSQNQQQMGQQNQQFMYGQQTERRGQDLNAGLQRQSLSNQTNNLVLQAAQLALTQPQRSYSFNTDNYGQPMSGMDQQSYAAYQKQQADRARALTTLQSLQNFNPLQSSYSQSGLSRII